MEKEIQECCEFFAQPFPVLIEASATTFDGCQVVEATTQYIDRLCLVFDLVSTECYKEITCLSAPTSPPTNVFLKK